MATVGLIQPWPMGLVPGRLMLTASHLIPRLSTRRTARTVVTTVSPSAVWYTGYIFVRSGLVALDVGSLRFSGLNGYDWSRSAVTYGVGTWAANSYWFEFTASESRPSHGPDIRWYGLPVRCLV